MPRPRKCRCGCGQPIPGNDSLRTAATGECAIKIVRADRAKDRAKQEKAERKDLRERKKAIKPLSTLCKEARKIIQKWARLRDSQYGACICCGIARIDDGAHLFPVGTKYRTARLSLNPDQIHGACSACNRFVGGGNILGYHAGLESRYGPQKLPELQELKRRADHKEDAPLTKDEVTEIKRQYSAMIRSYEMERL